MGTTYSMTAQTLVERANYGLTESTAPPIDTYEQKEPDYINKVPIPSSSLKPKVLFWCKVTSS